MRFKESTLELALIVVVSVMISGGMFFNVQHGFRCPDCGGITFRTASPQKAECFRCQKRYNDLRPVMPSPSQ